MYHRLQRLPLSRTLESPTPECFLPVQIRMPQRRQREQAPVPVQIRVLRPVPARARAQYSTRYRTPRSNSGRTWDRRRLHCECGDADVGRWSYRCYPLPRSRRLPRRVAPHRPMFRKGGPSGICSATVRFQLDVRSISTRIIGSGNRNRARCGRVERGADVDSEVDSVMSRVVTPAKVIRSPATPNCNSPTSPAHRRYLHWLLLRPPQGRPVPQLRR